jgi:acetolactate synthase-1/2/3 large subunit
MSEDLSGADALVRTLADCGVAACFANPGTSEMHLVTALDREPRIRSVLCLFEGVATGAADGYARIAGKPAMTLLHLGPGYLNGAANLHDARRAHMPTINVIGDHATYHRHLDAPLTSDIEGLTAPLAAWTDVVHTPAEAGAKAAAAFAAAHGPPNGNAMLLLPADSAWTAGGVKAAPAPAPRAKVVDDQTVTRIAAAIRAAKKPSLLVNGDALLEPGLSALARIEAAGVFVLADTFVTRIARGAGRYAPPRLPYFAEQAVETLEGVDVLVVAGTKHPVAFFAYPGRPSELTPPNAERLALGGPEIAVGDALARLADALNAPKEGPSVSAARPGPAGSQPLGAWQIGETLARHLPENAILADDAVTSGQPIYNATQAGPRHDWLGHTGGAIGQGLPLVVGAAVAAAGQRKVVALCGDGASMYTCQALWTLAREKLDVLVLIFANRSYRILTIELMRTGAGNPGPIATSMLSLDDPAIDFVKLAEAQGVPGVRCSDARDFDVQFARLVGAKGPALIECIL